MGQTLFKALNQQDKAPVLMEFIWQVLMRAGEKHKGEQETRIGGNGILFGVIRKLSGKITSRQRIE